MSEDQSNPRHNEDPSRRRLGVGCRRSIVTVQTEHEQRAGWEYDVVIEHANGVSDRHRVSLAWCDHDYWSGGRTAPSRVVQTVIEYALSQMEAGAHPLPAKFDAARLRRLFPDLDSNVRFGPAAA